ncbi:MAG: trypsin-like peptidase domain-containing protein [Planctomycetota bacterium]
MPRTHAQRLRLLLLNLVAAAAGAVGVHSQSFAQPAPALVDVARPQAGVAAQPADRRQREFEQLARDVESMDRLLGLVKRVVKLVTPSVVHIEAQPVSEYRVRSNAHEAGSGVIVSFAGGDGARDRQPRNYVLTNRHVIKNSGEPYIRIQLADGRVIRPTRVWDDPYTDVAVLAVDAAGLTPARLGDSDAVEIGEWVLAVGSPFGLSQSVTRGIISAKGRYNLELGDGEVRYQNFLQTDAAINPGNSGGPLINMRGEVIGLNTAIASESGGNEGIGFSIPGNIAARIAEELTRTGRVRRGFLGVKLDGLFDDKRALAAGLPRLVGTRIKGVEPGSPAERAALQPNDVILSYGGVRVEDDMHLISLVKLTEIGKRVEMVIFRGGEPLQMQVQIAGQQPVLSGK